MGESLLLLKLMISWRLPKCGVDGAFFLGEHTNGVFAHQCLCVSCRFAIK